MTAKPRCHTCKHPRKRIVTATSKMGRQNNSTKSPATVSAMMIDERILEIYYLCMEFWPFWNVFGFSFGWLSRDGYLEALRQAHQYCTTIFK